MATVAVALLIVLIGVGAPALFLIRILSGDGAITAHPRINDRNFDAALSSNEYSDPRVEEALQNWMTRALSAEIDRRRLQDQLLQLRAEMARFQGATPDSGAEDRYLALRRLIAKEFHPDFSQALGQEKTIRAEIFKQVWPKIEKIEARYPR
jgi:hypothetical protein